MKTKHRFEVLDIFRGIFASMVVLFHLSPFADTPLLNNPLVDNGDMFVDFFFVLSGFVIAYNYGEIRSSGEAKNFLSKRLWRIYPLHLIMLLAFLVVELSKNSLAAYIHVNNSVKSNDVFSFISSLLLINSIKLPGIQDVSWNIPSWSISAEMVAYIVFAGVLMLIYTLNLQKAKGFIFLAVAGLAAFSLKSLTGTYRLNYSFDYGFLRGIAGFFSGAFSLIIFQITYGNIHKLSRYLFDLLEPVILAVILYMIVNGEQLKETGLVYDLEFVAAIYIFSFEKGFVSALLKKPVILSKVGMYSYSIYMTHTLILSLFNIVFIRILKLPPSAYVYLVFLNYYLIYKVSEWTYHHIEMTFKGLPDWLRKHLYPYNPANLPQDRIEAIRKKITEQQTGQPDVSIVVPAYNEEANLLHTLSSLASQQTTYSVELLVVNNNSVDRTQEILDRCGVRSVLEKRPGVAYARQAGLEAARGRFMANADADCIYPAGWVEAMIRPLEKPDVACTYGLYSFLPSGHSSRLALMAYEKAAHLVNAIRNRNRAYLNVYGFNFAFRRADALAVGGFELNSGREGSVAELIAGGEAPPDSGRCEDGLMAMALEEQKKGRILRIARPAVRVWTSDRRLVADGSLAQAFTRRVRKSLQEMGFYLSSSKTTPS
nr:glycosyltransferase [uncultured Arsenicibacter sp.]